MERYTNAYGSKGSYGKQYELGSVNRVQGGSRGHTRLDEGIDEDLPIQDTTTLRDGSQERIIRKDVQWRVDYENERKYT